MDYLLPITASKLIEHTTFAIYIKFYDKTMTQIENHLTIIIFVEVIYKNNANVNSNINNNNNNDPTNSRFIGNLTCKIALFIYITESKRAQNNEQ